MWRITTRNVLAQIISRAFLILFSLFLIRAITSFLGKESFGIYGFVTAVVLLFGTVVDLGTQIIVVREASKYRSIYKEKQNELFDTVLILRFLLALVGFLLINFIVRIYPPWKEFVLPMTISSVVLLFLSLKTTINAIFQTFLRLDYVSFIEIVGSGSFLLLSLFAIFYGFGINLVVGAWVVGAGVSVVLGFLLVRSKFSLGFGFNPEIAREIVLEALPVGVLLLVFSVYNRVDIIILEYFHGVGDVAVYNLAYKVHENLILGAAFIMNALFPIISKNFADNKEGVRSIYQKAFGILSILGLFIALVFFILAPIVVNILTGHQAGEFSESILVLRILLLATFMSYLNHLTGFSLIAAGRQKLSLLVGVGALFVNLMLNFLFIPRYSFLAAAVVTGITEFFVLIASSFLIWNILGIAPNPKIVINTIEEFALKRWKK